MGEQNRRMVDGIEPVPAPGAGADTVAGPPAAAPRPPPADGALDANLRDEAQTRRMAPDTANPGEAAG